MPANDPLYQMRYMKKHYRENRQEYIDKSKARKKSLMAAVRVLKTTCSRCPETDPRCIDFHHLDPKQKVMSIADMVRLGYGLPRILKEIAKCIMLCANCHRKETLTL